MPPLTVAEEKRKAYFCMRPIRAIVSHAKKSDHRRWGCGH